MKGASSSEQKCCCCDLSNARQEIENEEAVMQRTKTSVSGCTKIGYLVSIPTSLQYVLWKKKKKKTLQAISPG